MKSAESIEAGASVRGSMVNAHLAWAKRELGCPLEELAGKLPAGHRRLVERTVLASQWVPLGGVIALDKAIAELAGGSPISVFVNLGRESARQNLGGVYRSFQTQDAHRFFSRAALLHSRFQNFGRARYEALGESSGELSIAECTSYSPVYCAGERGYLLEAMTVLGLSEAPKAMESACTCAGDPACVFALAW